MFVETYLWLQERRIEGKSKDFIWNAILEDFLIHGRALIHFVTKSNGRDNDVIALDFFHDNINLYPLFSESFLDEWADNIGSRLVHVTTKPMPNLKSQQSWPIDNIVNLLAPGLISFLNAVSGTRLATDVKKDCFSHLCKLNAPKIPISVNVST
jgi:hypothetical protein